jgi:hypothetical protein
VAERLNAAVLKTVVGETQPGVRIPPPPPLFSESLRSSSRCTLDSTIFRNLFVSIVAKLRAAMQGCR